MTGPLLDLDVFDDDGHLRDVALAALADGQDVLPEEALSHADTCDVCCSRLADAALASARVGALLRNAHRPTGAATEVPTPWRAVGLVLALGLLGLAPSLSRLPRVIGDAVPVVTHFGPIVAHGTAAALHGARGALAVGVTLGASLVLIVFGLTVARWSRHEGPLS